MDENKFNSIKIEKFEILLELNGIGERDGIGVAIVTQIIGNTIDQNVSLEISKMNF